MIGLYVISHIFIEKVRNNADNQDKKITDYT